MKTLRMFEVTWIAETPDAKVPPEAAHTRTILTSGYGLDAVAACRDDILAEQTAAGRVPSFRLLGLALLGEAEEPGRETT